MDTFFFSSFIKSSQILARVFSRAALETYLTRLQDVVKGEIGKWCTEAGPVEVYTAARSLTFRIAVRVLLGLKLDEQRIAHLSKTFEQLMNNLFSLPVDAPLSGLRKVRKHTSPHVQFLRLPGQACRNADCEHELRTQVFMITAAADHGSKSRVCR